MRRFLSLLLAAFLLLGALPAHAADNEAPAFADVPADAWYAFGISDVYRRGLMIGTGDELFSPEDTLTRAMVVTVLWRMAGEPAAEKAAPFTDVPGDRWYSASVAWAAENGVAEGYGGGLFGPTDPVTREELSAFLYRWARDLGADVSCDPSRYPGDGETLPSPWAKDAVAWARDRGLLNWRKVMLAYGGMGGSGSTGYRICPRETATRGETAVFVSRFCRIYLDETDVEPTVTFRPVMDAGNVGGYLWDFMTLELPETWQESTGCTYAGYAGVLEAMSVEFYDLSVYMARTPLGRLFYLTLYPEGKDSSNFGSWETLGEAAPGKSGRLCTVDAGPIMGRLCLYVNYFADEDGMWAEQGMRIYDPAQPGNCLKELADVEEILHSIRFSGSVKVVEAAAAYQDLMG